MNEHNEPRKSRNFSLTTKDGIELFTAYKLSDGRIAFPRKVLDKIENEDAFISWEDEGDTWYEKGIKR